MTIDTPRNNAFVSAYRTKFGADKPINVIGESAYNAAWLYALAVERAGTTNSRDVLRVIPDIEFEAPQGLVRISRDNNHMVSNNIIGRAREDGLWDVVRHNGPVEPLLPGCALRQ